MKNNLKKIIIAALSLLIMVNASACRFGSNPKEIAVEYNESGRIVKEPGGTFAGGYYSYEYGEDDEIALRYEYMPVSEEPYSVTEYFYEGGKLKNTVQENTDGAKWVVTYHENGKVAVDECYSNGLRDNTNYYNEKGENIRTTEYRDGIIYTDIYFDPDEDTDESRFICRDDRYDEEGNIKSSSRMAYDENGNFRTESYNSDPNIEGLYLKEVIVRMNKDWQSPTLEEIRYKYDGSIEYHFKYIYENGELIEKIKVDDYA